MPRDCSVRCSTQVAASGCVVVASIHQPSSEVFSEFDQLLILSHGQAVYMGAASEATGYFAALAPELQALPLCAIALLHAAGRGNALRCAISHLWLHGFACGGDQGGRA